METALRTVADRKARGEILRGVREITVYLRKLHGDPELKERTVREWIDKSRIPVKRQGASITGSKTVIRDYLMQPDPFPGSASGADTPPPLAAADATSGK
jgi:hypothetical protein